MTLWGVGVGKPSLPTLSLLTPSELDASRAPELPSQGLRLHPYLLSLCTCSSSRKPYSIPEGASTDHMFSVLKCADSCNSAFPSVPVCCISTSACILKLHFEVKYSLLKLLERRLSG